VLAQRYAEKHFTFLRCMSVSQIGATTGTSDGAGRVQTRPRLMNNKMFSSQQSCLYSRGILQEATAEAASLCMAYLCKFADACNQAQARPLSCQRCT